MSAFQQRASTPIEGVGTGDRAFKIDPADLATIDWSDKTTNWQVLLGVNVGCMVLMVLCVALRMWARVGITGTFFNDDVLIIIATAFTLAICSISTAAIKVGLGTHVWNLDFVTILPTVKSIIQLVWLCQIFYAVAIAFTKLSILALYVRIFPNKLMRILTYATGAFTILFGIASVCVTIFQCSPVHAVWDFDLPDASCPFPYMNFLYASAATNVATDILVCTMPLPYFWRLNMPKKQKLIVCFLFFIGGVACLCSLVRIPFIRSLYSLDITYNLVNGLIWSIMECSLGIICVAIPPMRPLLGRLFPKFFRSMGSAAAAASRNNVYAMESVRRTHASVRRPSTAVTAPAGAKSQRLSTIEGRILAQIDEGRFGVKPHPRDDDDDATTLDGGRGLPSRDGARSDTAHSRDSSTEELTDKKRTQAS